MSLEYVTVLESKEELQKLVKASQKDTGASLKGDTTAQIWDNFTTKKKKKKNDRSGSSLLDKIGIDLFIK